MTSSMKLLTVAAAALVSVVSFETAHARPTALAQAQPSLPEGAGKEVVEKVCTACHGLDYLVPSQRTVQTWREIVDLMKAYGAEATDEQWTAITDYIIATLAHLNVNKGSADEYGMLFRVDAKTAQGVVAYRDTQGGFKTVDDLKKAPGLDAAQIDALNGRLIFE
ncbi:MAG: helix-hairpin-helix domain-containing protein [Acidobacteria bacterium]|nr:helix-hairpin-helix domain-containing protein [Acidobacteriota bacterium]